VEEGCPEITRGAKSPTTVPQRPSPNEGAIGKKNADAVITISYLGKKEIRNPHGVEK